MTTSRGGRHGRAGRAWAVVALVLLSLATAQPALADGGEATDEGYVMVQGALSFLLNDPGPTGRKQALAMVDDALGADDQDGVDVTTLEAGKAALAAGRAGDARRLLQNSIRAAVADLPPATGEASGTGVVLPPLRSQAPIEGFDWLFLAVSALALVVGGGLSYLFRPRESLRELRRDVLAARNAVGADADAR